MRFKVICIGGVLQEIIYNTDEADILKRLKYGKQKRYIALDFGAKISSNQVYRSFGGGALNSLATFFSTGLPAAPMSIVGDDLSGHEIIHYLGKKKISRRFIKLDNGKETAFSFVLNLPRDKEHVLFVSQGVLNKFKFKDYNLRSINTDWFFITSLRGSYANYNLREIFHYARRNQVKIFWNPGKQQLENFNQYKKYLAQIDFLSLNQAEAKFISKLLRFKAKAMKDIMKQLINNGCQAVIVTDGDKGAYYYDGELAIKQVAKKVKVIVNTTGAGDAFNAGFLAAYIKYKGKSEPALRFASLNAAAVIQTIGAHQGVLTKKDL